MRTAFAFLLLVTLVAPLHAEVGDPQIRTDHAWYPGELACSTFARLFATQEEAYRRVTGKTPSTDEERALASWMWRNTHYYHGEEGAEDLWGKGFGKGGDGRTRDYWTGLFAHGFGLCGTTHSQWCAEMEALLGHGRGRGVGVQGHNSFEVFLKGGPYGEGKWVLLDHDISTVVYDDKGKALLSIPEVQKDWKRLTNRTHLPLRQPWIVCGLHPGDGGVFRQYNVAEYFAGYQGAPPMVHLRRGETLKRTFEPGLADGKTYVFWGRNYSAGGVPGPERSLTWVNQPERIYQSKSGVAQKVGQARYGNAVYTYKPDLQSADYREGVIDEGEEHVTFELQTPYIIGATPPNQKDWGIYDAGCKNGLVLRGAAKCRVRVSVDRGATFQDCGAFRDGMDLTDFVKGHRQYQLRFETAARALRDSGLTITTVCQANAAILPRLKEDGSLVTLEASGKGVLSAGPTLRQAQKHVVAGSFDSPKVTLELKSPKGQPVAALYAVGHIRSSNPPRPDVKYQIEYSTDAGATWKPLVKNWQIPRRGDEPRDFWSQSFCWGHVDIDQAGVTSVQVRFHNNGGKSYARAEAQLVYRLPRTDAAKVTYAWTDDKGPHTASHVFDVNASWTVPTGRDPKTHWVEMEPVVK